MKLLMIICPEERHEALMALMAEHGVHAYTELSDLTGAGTHGKRLGSHAWPGRSDAVFAVLPPEKKDELMDALRECRERLFPGEGVHAFVIPVEETL